MLSNSSFTYWIIGFVNISFHFGISRIASFSLHACNVNKTFTAVVIAAESHGFLELLWLIWRGKRIWLRKYLTMFWWSLLLLWQLEQNWRNFWYWQLKCLWFHPFGCCCFLCCLVWLFCLDSEWFGIRSGFKSQSWFGSQFCQVFYIVMIWRF